MKTEPKTRFEWEVCGRCGGSGQYSYNQINGSTCFGCGGSGHRLTKRGSAARKFFIDLVSVNASEIVVGDQIEQSDLSRRYFARVSSVMPSTMVAKMLRDGVMVDAPPAVMIETTHSRYGRMGLHTSGKVRKLWPADVTEAKIAEALAYQATLTKTGKPAKRA